MGSGPDDGVQSSSFLPISVKLDLASNAWLGIKTHSNPWVARLNPLGDTAEARAGAAGAVVFSGGALAGVAACCASKVVNPCANRSLPKRGGPIHILYRCNNIISGFFFPFYKYPSCKASQTRPSNGPRSQPSRPAEARRVTTAEAKCEQESKKGMTNTTTFDGS